MGFFSKKVTDPDLCYIRDAMDIAGVLAKETSLTIAKEWMKQIMEQHGLLQKSFDYASSNIVALDCYPSNQQVKFRRAQELLKVANTLNLPGISHSNVISVACKCIKKMGFTYQEKIKLIDTCIVKLTGIESVDNFFISTYINQL